METLCVNSTNPARPFAELIKAGQACTLHLMWEELSQEGWVIEHAFHVVTRVFTYELHHNVKVQIELCWSTNAASSTNTA